MALADQGGGAGPETVHQRTTQSAAAVTLPHAAGEVAPTVPFVISRARHRQSGKAVHLLPVPHGQHVQSGVEPVEAQLLAQIVLLIELFRASTFV